MKKIDELFEGYEPKVTVYDSIEKLKGYKSGPRKNLVRGSIPKFFEKFSVSNKK